LNLKAVFFDMGGTIDTHTYDRRAGIEATAEIRRLLSQAGLDIHGSDEELYDLINEGLRAYRRWREISLVELSPEKVWPGYILKNYPLETGQLDGIAEDLTYTVDTRYYQRSMRPEVPTVLKALRGMGLKLGIISNIQSRGQVPDDLNRYGIRGFFDPVVLSCVYGRRKPDPAIFRYAAGRMNVPPEACVHIGDRISRDILGAKRAGFALVLQIRHDFKETPDPEVPRPDAVLNSIAELPGLLESTLNLSSQTSPGP
jgi:putative hydrolase of the HAD superfamily